MDRNAHIGLAVALFVLLFLFWEKKTGTTVDSAAQNTDKQSFIANYGSPLIDGKSDDGAGESHQRRHQDGAKDDLDIGFFEELCVGRQREFTDDEAGKVVERIEALQQKREERADVNDADPQQRRE